jgi:subtilisin family serine protease
MMKKAAAIVLAAGLSTALFAATPADKRAAFAVARVEAKSGLTARLGPVLNALYKAQSSSATAASAQRSLTAVNKIGRLRRLLNATDGYINVDVALTGKGSDARAAFESYGVTNVSTYENHLSGRVPIAALGTLARNSSVVAVRPALSRTRAGVTTTQGDKAQRSDDGRRNFGLTGFGVKVGVLSDSFDCTHAPLVNDPEANYTTAAEDATNNDLPRVQVLKDLPEPDCSEIGTDEGRAILQLLHDVAPGSKLAFYTASVGQADMAAGIKALADAGARIIVDDVIYFAEPMFQDGVIAQSVDSVKARGVTYFSSAGNDERQSYEAAYRRSADAGLNGVRHNFGTRRSPDTLQLITADPGALTLLTFQWDQPFASVSGAPGSRSDLDVIFYDTNGDPIEPCNDNLEPDICQFAGVDSNEGFDPLELALISNATDSSVDVNLSIELYSGPAPGKIKYVWFDLDPNGGAIHLDEFATDSGTTYGHTNAAGAESVGAAAWYNTAEWGSPLWGNACKPACAEYFSSAGGVPILFDKRGRRLPVPLMRLKPGVTGPDGGNTSFFFSRTTDPRVGGGEPDQYPNFFGTSASAPHVAGIAALMLEQMKRNGKGRSIDLPAKRVPDFILTTLRATSSDIRNRAGRTIVPYAVEHANGYDFDTGFGYVDAVKALTVVKALKVSTD